MAKKITERQIIGWYFMQLAAFAGMGWINAISNFFRSDQAIETYPWLTMSPAMREWIGGRNAKGFTENYLQIKNKLYEATIEFLVSDLKRDKTGQIRARIEEFATKGNSHWASLLSTLILSGAATTCYDGQYFFDDDHEEGDSGSQSNDLSIDISALPAVKGGSTTAPSVEEMQLCIMQAITAIMGFKDDQGEPMNEDALKFLVMVPMSLWQSAVTAAATPTQVAASQTAFEGLRQQGLEISVVPNARLSTWTESFAVFRADGKIKPLIRQEESDVELKVKGYGSEFEFDNNAHQYGIDASRNVGLGRWQGACLVTMT
ncbi:MAG: hypothetical protein HOE02_05625 [Candidatus Marinimicrobia bacterium]|jgi:phage major head subunit gpT-like protein|nr:hypothetical protein [Candidatus Neomarinimicrobiota bacterium]